MEDKNVIIERLDNLKEWLTSFVNEIRDWKDCHIEEHRKIWIEIATLRVKAGVWGMIGGFLMIAISLLIAFFTGVIHK